MKMKNICVIGNSHVGAVVKAYRENPSVCGYRFTFFGAPWPQFDEISIVNNWIIGGTFSYGEGSCDVRTYDAFVVYGGVSCAQQIALSDQEMLEQGYSQAVRSATFRNMISHSVARKIVWMLHASSRKPVFVLSNNPLLNLFPVTAPDAFRIAEELLREGSDPGRYLSFPLQLVGDGFLPKRQFFKDSVYIDGDQRDDHFEFHDNEHMNITGGRLVLDGLIGALQTVPL